MLYTRNGHGWEERIGEHSERVRAFPRVVKWLCFQRHLCTRITSIYTIDDTSRANAGAQSKTIITGNTHSRVCPLCPLTLPLFAPLSVTVTKTGRPELSTDEPELCRDSYGTRSTVYGLEETC